MGVLPIAAGICVAYPLYIFPASNPETIANAREALATANRSLPNYITNAIPFFFLFILLEFGIALVRTNKDLSLQRI